MLVDHADIAERMATISRDTAIDAAGQDEDGSFRYHQLLRELVIGLGRFARGERLSIPDLRPRLTAALELPIPDLVDEMLAVIAGSLVGRVPAATPDSLESVRALLQRTRRAELASAG